MMTALVSTLLPSVMLSGLIFAIRNMPPLLQGLAHLMPAKYFVTIIRGIMLKGAGLDVLVGHGSILVGLAIVLISVAAKMFSTRVE